MGVGALSQQTLSGLVPSSPMWEGRSLFGTKPKILTVGWVSGVQGGTAASWQEFGIGRPSAIGINPTSPQAYVDEDDGNAPTFGTTGAVAWGTGPTQPSAFHRRYTGPNAASNQGTGFNCWFPGGFGISPTSSIVLWFINSSGLSPNTNVGDLYSTVEE